MRRKRRFTLLLGLPVALAVLLAACGGGDDEVGRIAFTSDRGGNSDIYLMNADGSGQTRLTTNSAWDQSPAWSRDGAKIAFVSNRDGNEDIYVINADGTGETRLTTSGASFASAPVWSP